MTHSERKAKSGERESRIRGKERRRRCERNMRVKWKKRRWVRWRKSRRWGMSGWKGEVAGAAR